MNKKLSLLWRVINIVCRDPNILPTVIRMEWRHRRGIFQDQRYHPGYSAPPTNLSIVPTMRCNLDCIMCRQPRWDLKGAETRPWYDPRRELSLETWVTLLDQVKSFRPWIYLTGGEPLMYRQLPELVQAARERHLEVQLQTNGSLLSGVADFLCEVGVVAVTVSLDGPPAVHDAIRGKKGIFQKIAEGIQALVAARKKTRRPKPILSVNFTLSKANLDTLPDMVSLVVRLGVDEMQVQHTMFNSPEKVARHNQLFSPAWVQSQGLDMAFPSIREGGYYQSEITEADLPILRAGLDEARRLASQHGLSLRFLPNLPNELLAPYYLDLDYPFVDSCNFFWKTLRVYADGSVSPCLNLILGNIKEELFPDLWNSPRMQEVRRQFGKHLFPGCVRCCQRHYINSSRAF